jgi:hypothetical protein
MASLVNKENKNQSLETAAKETSSKTQPRAKLG